ncbi:hypothetical protein J4N45_10935 [Vibrio sp. SCSIO 43140]|uniref:type-F conjugative transfer system secretin TraK n=1 Tax=Vibrio sp. SCSIO 43140 TaxID=2819100 RepID=UPI002075FD3C|nr:type-F conjugative transfer system secretin TraK [Vibrio sp. SCSIO 43140]USD59045.1 hypothetical protein J4N45_10935 [Vibrio sp. SCSIO 43140]
MKKLLATTLLAAFGATSTAYADIEVLPIQPIGKKVEVQKVESSAEPAASDSTTTTAPSKDTVNQMISQVVDSLPASKQKSLNEYIPKPATPSQTAAVNSAVDEFGRAVNKTANGTGTIQGTPQQAQPAASRVKPELSAFEKMQRQMAKKFKPVQKYKLRPSDNITIPAAKYILNSIRTSFEEIKVRSSDPNVVMKVEGSFIYFTSNSEAPFNLILFEKGVPETQVNLTIWPLDVMPAMVHVDVAYNRSLKAKVARVIKEREQEEHAQEERIRDMESELALASQPEMTNAPYEERINTIFATIAGRNNPSGFDLQTNIPDSARYPCRFGAFAETQQRLISSRQIVDIVLVTNKRNHNVILREDECWVDDDVIATGILNKSTLKPNEKTEVYVMRDRLHYQRIQTRNERPSLLD